MPQLQEMSFTRRAVIGGLATTAGGLFVAGLRQSPPRDIKLPEGMLNGATAEYPGLLLPPEFGYAEWQKGNVLIDLDILHQKAQEEGVESVSWKVTNPADCPDFQVTMGREGIDADNSHNLQIVERTDGKPFVRFKLYTRGTVLPFLEASQAGENPKKVVNRLRQSNYEERFGPKQEVLITSDQPFDGIRKELESHLVPIIQYTYGIVPNIDIRSTLNEEVIEGDESVPDNTLETTMNLLEENNNLKWLSIDYEIYDHLYNNLHGIYDPSGEIGRNLSNAQIALGRFEKENDDVPFWNGEEKESDKRSKIVFDFANYARGLDPAKNIIASSIALIGNSDAAREFAVRFVEVYDRKDVTLFAQGYGFVRWVLSLMASINRDELLSTFPAISFEESNFIIDEIELFRTTSPLE